MSGMYSQSLKQRIEKEALYVNKPTTEKSEPYHLFFKRLALYVEGYSWTEKVAVRFSPKVRPYIEKSLWHHSQIISKENDGAIRFEVDAAEPREVILNITR